MQHEHFNQSSMNCYIFKELVDCSLSINIGLSIVVGARAGGSAAENHYRSTRQQADDIKNQFVSCLTGRVRSPVFLQRNKYLSER